MACLQKKCWTADKLAKRGLPHPDACPLCDQVEENIQHLLVGCVFSRQLWFSIFQTLKLTQLAPNILDSSFPKWWRKTTKLVPKEKRQGLNSLIILIAWEIWKHRNTCVFENERPCISVLIIKIVENCRLWWWAGAAKLQDFLVWALDKEE